MNTDRWLAHNRLRAQDGAPAARRTRSQGELAEQVGVILYTISHLNLGIKQPRFKKLRGLAAAPGI